MRRVLTPPECWEVSAVEPVTVYERMEAMYQRAWRFQLQHSAQLEPQERDWLAQILHDLTYDLDQLAATLIADSPWVRPPSPTDPPEVLLQMAERALWLAGVTSRQAERSLWLAELVTTLTQRTLQGIEPMLRQAQ